MQNLQLVVHSSNQYPLHRNRKYRNLQKKIRDHHDSYKSKLLAVADTLARFMPILAKNALGSS